MHFPQLLQLLANLIVLLLQSTNLHTVLERKLLVSIDLVLQLHYVQLEVFILVLQSLDLRGLFGSLHFADRCFLGLLLLVQLL